MFGLKRGQGTSRISYKRRRVLRAVILHAVWLYFRFTLSFREVEEMLAQRGVEVSYECFEGMIHGFVGMLGVMAAGRHALHRSGQMLQAAFGLAVSTTMAITTILFAAFARTRWAFGWREAHFLWWSGLRGALALALALAIPPEAPYRDAILVGAFAVVAFSRRPFGIHRLG